MKIAAYSLCFMFIVQLITSAGYAAPFAYVIADDSNELIFIDLATDTIIDRRSISEPESLAIHPDGSKLYVVSESIAAVRVFNATTHAVITNIPFTTGEDPGVFTTPDGQRVIATNEDNNCITIINASTNTVITTLVVGSGPHNGTASLDSQFAYIPNGGSGTVSVVNLTSNSVVKTITVGNSPRNAATTKDGAFIYVNNLGSGTVSVIDTTTNTVSNTITVGSAPRGLAMSSTSDRACIANHSSNTISVVNTKTHAVLATVPVLSRPLGCSFTPDDQKIYVVYRVNNAPMTVINANTYTVSYSFNTGADEHSNETSFISYGPNSAPDAVSDNALTHEDTAVVVNVVTNDTDANGDPLTITAVTQPANGSVVNNGTSVTFTPTSNFNGSTSFTYTVSDGRGGSDTATVNVTVSAVDDTPTANDDAATTHEDTSTSIFVLSNDTDIEGDPLTITSVIQPANGIVINSGTSLIYSPNPNFFGSDSFSYTNDVAETVPATVTITITPVDDAPILGSDSYSTQEDNDITLTVLTNDIEVDGETLTITQVTNPGFGTVIQQGSTLVYTPAANYSGIDSFTYTAEDTSGNQATATITVNISSQNDAPQASNDDWTTTSDKNLAMDLLNNDTDVDGDVLVIASYTMPTHGSLIPQGTMLMYQPQLGFVGTDTFTYTISDNQGGEHTATITVTVLPLVITTTDTDFDGINDNDEIALGTDPNRTDTDDDGVLDGDELAYNSDSDNDGLINARDPDSDNDGLFDGTEVGVTQPLADTDLSQGHFIPDADPTTTTSPVDADSDNGSISDGDEDANHNGKIDDNETDPNNGNDDVAIDDNINPPLTPQFEANDSQFSSDNSSSAALYSGFGVEGGGCQTTSTSSLMLLLVLLLPLPRKIRHRSAALTTCINLLQITWSRSDHQLNIGLGKLYQENF